MILPGAGLPFALRAVKGKNKDKKVILFLWPQVAGI